MLNLDIFASHASTHLSFPEKLFPPFAGFQVLIVENDGRASIALSPGGKKKLFMLFYLWIKRFLLATENDISVFTRSEEFPFLCLTAFLDRYWRLDLTSSSFDILSKKYKRPSHLCKYIGDLLESDLSVNHPNVCRISRNCTLNINE